MTAGSRPKRVAVFWSSGKDSTWALHRLADDPETEVAGLVTTLTSDFDRVSMHAVRRALVEAQARALDLPLWTAEIPKGATNAVYEARMAALAPTLAAAAVEALAFGDLFLADVRAYRERQWASQGFDLLFPLWGEPTRRLADDMIAGGLSARVTCVDPRKLSPGLAGGTWDKAFLDTLPEGVDPLGENGEFHTFVTDAPLFRGPVAVVPGEVVLRDGFAFADLLPAA